MARERQRVEFLFAPGSRYSYLAASQVPSLEAAEEAHRRGAFGVPTFFVGDRMFWGNDRIVLLRHALARPG